jgi:hypothetical protein
MTYVFILELNVKLRLLLNIFATLICSHKLVKSPSTIIISEEIVLLLIANKLFVSVVLADTRSRLFQIFLFSFKYLKT